MASSADHPGLVKWYNVKAGYGFIQDLRTGKDVFCHASGLTRSLKDRPLREGDQVLLAIREGKKGPEAREVVPVSSHADPRPDRPLTAQIGVALAKISPGPRLLQTTNKQQQQQNQSQRETNPRTGRRRRTTYREKMKKMKKMKMKTKMKMTTKKTTRRRMRKWTSWVVEVKGRPLRPRPASQISPPTPSPPPASRKKTTAG
ncbi:Cold shock-like protein CspB [Portunus trituberculatus]|uniref:Cold shock-like protein CspB n=1 Tax=Portunus trituberculatus TaxID=210409 RepID=A0A5B7GKQ0_PORTR|nr:Cold shock-like protein CspB [Portunus trituberculatus]